MPVLILGLLAFTVLWPLWFTVDGALMASDELTAALGPALLDTADGGYLESKNHCVLVHLDGIRQTPEGSPSFYATLDEAEHEFASSAFLRIHKSYLINGDHILQMSNYKVLLDTGMTLKGSRKYFSKAKLEFYRGR